MMMIKEMYFHKLILTFLHILLILIFLNQNLHFLICPQIFRLLIFDDIIVDYIFYIVNILILVISIVIYQLHSYFNLSSLIIKFKYYDRFFLFRATSKGLQNQKTQ